MLKISLTKNFKNFEEKFKYFYKYRFDDDYLRQSLHKKNIKKNLLKNGLNKIQIKNYYIK